jgi:hypothetical protein
VIFFEVGRTDAAPRLRQSLAALGCGYGLNEKLIKPKTKNKAANSSFPLCHRAYVRAPLPAVEKKQGNQLSVEESDANSFSYPEFVLN